MNIRRIAAGVALLIILFCAGYAARLGKEIYGANALSAAAKSPVYHETKNKEPKMTAEKSARSAASAISVTDGGVNRDVEDKPNPEAASRRYHPRDPYEWQGRRVDLDVSPICSPETGCGLALACKNNKCGPCDTDSECMPGERCVLDRCLVEQNVGCTGRKQCEDAAPTDERDIEHYCVLVGDMSDWRGNRQMKSVCLAARGPTPDEYNGPAGNIPEEVKRLARRKPNEISITEPDKLLELLRDRANR